MNLYLVVWILICILGAKDFFFKSTTKIRKIEFDILMMILLAMLIFRFGQGTDYFGYRYIYNRLSSNGFDFSIYETVHGEIGYLLICNLFRCAKAPFELFVACTAVLEICCFYRFCRWFQIDSPFVLILAYPTLYMTYFVSAIRQGIVIAIFLGILLPLYFNRQFKWYAIIAALCVSIHSVALVFLLILFLNNVKHVNFIQFCCFLSWIMGFTLTFPVIRRAIMLLGISKINYYMMEGSSLSVISICERLFFIGIVTWLYSTMKKKNVITSVYQRMYLIYLTSMSIYGFFVGYSNIASRLSGVMRFVELFLLIDGIKKIRFDNRRLLACFFVIFESMMLAKNINSYIEQGNYYNNTNIFSYEYVSIFNEDKIFNIRNVEKVYLLPNEIDREH